MRNIFLFALAMCFIIYAATTCSESGSKATSENAESSLETPPVVSKPPQHALFKSVELVLAKLSGLDAGTLGNWKEIDHRFYASSPYYQFGKESAANGLKNNLAFYVESDNVEYIQVVKLMLNVNNAAQSESALKKYEQTATKALKKMAIIPPAGFEKALRTGKPFTGQTETVSIVNEVHNDRIDWYKLVITAK